MIPSAYTEDLQESFSIETPVSRTYKLRFDGKPSVGMMDELEAVKQAVYLLLQTDRFLHPIFSWDYGIEREDWQEEDSEEELESLIEDGITEALLQDDRILEVTDFTFERRRDVLSVQFTVGTIFGDIQEEREVRADGVS